MSVSASKASTLVAAVSLHLLLIGCRVEVERPDPVKYYNTGIEYCKSGQLNEAAEALQKAIHIKPDFAEAYADLGATYNKMGRFQDALTASNMRLRSDRT